KAVLIRRRRKATFIIISCPCLRRPRRHSARHQFCPARPESSRPESIPEDHTGFRPASRPQTDCERQTTCRSDLSDGRGSISDRANRCLQIARLERRARSVVGHTATNRPWHVAEGSLVPEYGRISTVLCPR